MEKSITRAEALKKAREFLEGLERDSAVQFDEAAISEMIDLVMLGDDPSSVIEAIALKFRTEPYRPSPHEKRRLDRERKDREKINRRLKKRAGTNGFGDASLLKARYNADRAERSALSHKLKYAR